MNSFENYIWMSCIAFTVQFSERGFLINNQICDCMWEMLASTYTTARHTFYYQMVVVHINEQFRQVTIGAESYQTVLLWLVSGVCQMFTSAWVVFKCLHLPWTSSQPAVSHHTTGWCIWPLIYLLCVCVEVKIAPMDAIWLSFSVDIALALHFMASHPHSPPS